MFDVYKEKKFKAVESLKEVPRIILFKQGHEIHYTGLKNFPSLFQFLEEKLDMDTVQEIHSLKEFDMFKEKFKGFFVRNILISCFCLTET